MKIKKIVILGGTFFSLLLSIKAYAGGINGNEQSVMGVVQGSFEYEGITYRGAPGYIEKARSYLMQEDVDLTSEQAGEVISNIYANVQTGVTEGYIIPANAAEESKNPEKSQEDPSKEVNDKKNPNQKPEKEPVEEPKKETVIQTTSGNIEVINKEGTPVFVSKALIKDTGYQLSGIVILPLLLLMGIGSGFMYLVKYSRLAQKDES